MLHASYTDRGAPDSNPLTTNATVELRHPRIPAAFADAHVGYERFRDSLSGGCSPSHLMFRDIDLTGVTSIVCEYSAQDEGGLIEFRVDSYAGPLIASSKIQPTGSWEKTASTTLTWPVVLTGKHDIYLIVLRSHPPDDRVAVMRSVTFNSREFPLPIE